MTIDLVQLIVYHFESVCLFGQFCIWTLWTRILCFSSFFSCSFSILNIRWIDGIKLIYLMEINHMYDWWSYRMLYTFESIVIDLYTFFFISHSVVCVLFFFLKFISLFMFMTNSHHIQSININKRYCFVYFIKIWFCWENKKTPSSI